MTASRHVELSARTIFFEILDKVREVSQWEELKWSAPRALL